MSTIREMLLAEHSRFQTLRIIQHIGDDAGRLAELMEIFLGDDSRLTQVAAWPVGDFGKMKPEMMHPWLAELIGQLKKSGRHVAVRRNVLRVFEEIDLPEGDLLGELADAAFGFLADPQEANAVRAFSMTVCWRICQKEPELATELRALIENELEFGTPAFKSRGKKIVALLKKLP